MKKYKIFIILCIVVAVIIIGVVFLIKQNENKMEYKFDNSKLYITLNKKDWKEVPYDFSNTINHLNETNNGNYRENTYKMDKTKIAFYTEMNNDRETKIVDQAGNLVGTYRTFAVYLIYSDDNGVTWNKSLINMTDFYDTINSVEFTSKQDGKITIKSLNNKESVNTIITNNNGVEWKKEDSSNLEESLTTNENITSGSSLICSISSINDNDITVIAEGNKSYNIPKSLSFKNARTGEDISVDSISKEDKVNISGWISNDNNIIDAKEINVCRNITGEELRQEILKKAIKDDYIGIEIQDIKYYENKTIINANISDSIGESNFKEENPAEFNMNFEVNNTTEIATENVPEGYEQLSMKNLKYLEQCMVWIIFDAKDINSSCPVITRLETYDG